MYYCSNTVQHVESSGCLKGPTADKWSRDSWTITGASLTTVFQFCVFILNKYYTLILVKYKYYNPVLYKLAVAHKHGQKETADHTHTHTVYTVTYILFNEIWEFKMTFLIHLLLFWFNYFQGFNIVVTSRGNGPCVMFVWWNDPLLVSLWRHPETGLSWTRLSLDLSCPPQPSRRTLQVLPWVLFVRPLRWNGGLRPPRPARDREAQLDQSALETGSVR